MQVENCVEEINGHVTTMLHLLMKQHAQHCNVQQQPPVGPTSAAASQVPAYQQRKLQIKHFSHKAPAPLEVLDPSQISPRISAVAPSADPSSASIPVQVFQGMEKIQQHPNQQEWSKATIVFKTPTTYMASSTREVQVGGTSNREAVRMRKQSAAGSGMEYNPDTKCSPDEENGTDAQQELVQKTALPRQTTRSLPSPIVRRLQSSVSKCDKAQQPLAPDIGDDEVLGNGDSSRIRNGSQYAFDEQRGWKGTPANGLQSASVQLITPERIKSFATPTIVSCNSDKHPFAQTSQPKLLSKSVGSERRGRWSRSMRRVPPVAEGSPVSAE